MALLTYIALKPTSLDFSNIMEIKSTHLQSISHSIIHPLDLRTNELQWMDQNAINELALSKITF